MNNVFKSSLFAVFAIALASLTSCNAFAADYSVNSTVLGFNNNPSYYLNNGSWSYGGTGVKHITPPDEIQGMQIAKSNVGVSTDLIRGDVLTFNGYYVSPVLSTDVTFPVQSGGVISSLYSSLNCQIFDLQFTATQEYLVFDTTSYLRKTNFEFSCNVLSDNPSFLYINLSIDANLVNVSGNYIDFYISNVSVVRASSDENEERIADVLEEDHNKTVQDEQTASSGAGGFSFNFALPNPFSIFQVSDGCVNTPTIDSWLHLEGDWKSPHCPLIPANVRSVLTPVVTLIVTLATLLVVIRWVSSSAVDVAGNSSALIDKPKGDKK